MRNLAKGPKPDVLEANEAAWQKAVADKLAAGGEPSNAELSRYRHADIKKSLLEETFGKCAYCESKVRHIAYGDVEHVHPKDLNPLRRFDWSNLTIACDVCNTNKSNKINIIDPYVDDPESKFTFLGPVLVSRSGYPDARLTEVELKLNRIELVERRMRQMDRVILLAREARSVNDPLVRQALMDDIKRNETADDVEFTMTVRAYVRALIVEGEIDA